jgi:hypothetical protein
MEEMAQQSPDGERYSIKEPSLYENMYDFLESFEESINNQKKKALKTKKKKEKKGLEAFTEKEENNENCSN